MLHIVVAGAVAASGVNRAGAVMESQAAVLRPPFSSHIGAG